MIWNESGVEPRGAELGEKPPEFLAAVVSEVINEKAEAELNFQPSELHEILKDENFSPEKLIVLLKRQYHDTYNQDVQVEGGYDLERHTLMVLKQFEKYFSDKNLPANIDKGMFRLILALHDIGKPEAIAKEGKHFQHKYTSLYIQKLFVLLNLDKQHVDLALVLVSDDPLGRYIRGRSSVPETRRTIENMAQKAGISPDEFFELLCIYYKVDAGSYTENAGGIRALDYLFIFDEEKHELKFSSSYQKKIEVLGFKTN